MAAITTQADPRLMGYYLENGIWRAQSCSNSGEEYFTSGRYAACAKLFTDCVTEVVGSIGDEVKACTFTGFSCITQSIHATAPAPANDSNAALNIFCGKNFLAVDLYRALPNNSTATTTDASTILSTSTSSPSSTSSPTPTSTGTETTSPSATSSPSPTASQSKAQPRTNLGGNASAKVVGIAVLLLTGFFL